MEELSTAQRLVQGAELVGRQPLDSIENGPGARIGGPGLGLFFVRHRHNPQRDDFVDFGGVAEVTLTLVCHGGKVVQHDRR
jgi:hypothetical protein